MTAMSYYLMSISDWLSVVLISRLIVGVFKHSQNMCKSYLGEIHLHEDRPTAFGHFNAFSSAAFIFGPLIGGHIADSTGGFHAVCALSGTTFLVNIALCWLCVPEITHRGHETKINGGPTTDNSLHANNNKQPDDDAPPCVPAAAAEEESASFSPRQLLSSLFDRDMWNALTDVFVLQFMLSLPLIMYRTNFSMLLREKYATSHRTNGYITSLTTIVGVAASFGAGRAVRLYGNDVARLYLHASALLAVCLVALAYAPNLHVLLFFLALLSISSAIARICSRQIVVSRCHADEIGGVTGMSGTVTSVARMVAPLLGGIAMDVALEGPELLGIAIVIVAVGYMLKYPPVYDHDKAAVAGANRLSKKLK
ncbi:PREDICTED: major facilitator superfamily domain-containing protein 9-like isoform X2 [Priapulus caudatus]|nr:PREDICTED: major facilitator superfamily domain-containing protein 9-like isoform X2 [Priapulus caudatus]